MNSLYIVGVLFVVACTSALRVSTPPHADGAVASGGMLGSAGNAGVTGTGGAAGVATCPGKVDTQTDNDNCGACGNPCLADSPSTAQCTGGRCLVTLATVQGYPDGIAVDTSSV
jgi:hypothetical protein